jgi:hypothetical protein
MATSPEEAIARLTQIRNGLADATTRLSDIETRLTIAKATAERPRRVSLRQFTFNLVNQTPGLRTLEESRTDLDQPSNEPATASCSRISKRIT